MKCKVERIIVEKKYFQVEFEGLNSGTWVSVTERSRGFVVSIGFDMEELDWLMEHLKKVVEVEASKEFVTKRKPLFLVVPEGVKGKGWKILGRRSYQCKSILNETEEFSKEKNGDIRMNRDTFRGGRSYAKVVAEAGLRTGGRAIVRMMGMKGMVSINPISAFKGCFFVSSTRRAERVHDQGRLSMKGRTILLREMVAQGKYGGSRKGNEGGKGNFEAGGLDEGEAVVAVSVTGEDEDADAVTSEINRSRNEWVRVGGCVSQSSKAAEGLRGSVRDIECYRKRRLPRARYRQSRTCLADKGEIGGGWSRSGQVEAIYWPEHESSFKAHKRAASSTKASVTLCPDSARAGAEVFFGEEGRAIELKAQSLPNPRPLSDNIVGCKFKGPSGLGQNLGGTKPSGMEVWSRREEIEARKEKAPAVHMRDATREEETAISKKTCEDHNMEEEFGMGFQMERGIRVNPLSRCPLSGNLSKEDTSASPR
ncbi:hypothetical protein CK203_092151 [Vitis vinifera]|uniref:DUF4283 domain-containing protein n=1 Tax=Vitis vinifera TaxID=29760 RepID=A0A438DG82_VITVI|nr:hypothetical protein CK203_092151 [Vitis vinifera]